MNEEQAIDALKFNRPFAYTELREAVDVAIKALEEVQQYRAIGAVGYCRKAVDRMKPKKRGIWKSGGTCCPNCERGVVTEDRFCSYCGQALKPKEF